MKVWVKICGMTTVENAVEVCRLQPDAIGLNFYQRSKRSVDVDQAAEIVRAIPSTVEPVALFVNHTSEEIRSIASRTGITTIQLHGDETPEDAAQLSGFNIIRAFRVDETTLPELPSQVERHRELGVNLRGCLIDARVAGSYGGTGATAPWQLLQQCYDFERFPPLILAGGLTSKNVREAVKTVKPWGVDTASGVEASPGLKDIQQVAEFIDEANQSC